MQLGISSFGEVSPAHVAGGDYTAGKRMQELLALARLADEVGLDVLALGEHHRPDFIISAPEVILAAVAAVTRRIRLSSAVTVLSSADPVRVFQNFATVDLISGGRAEIIAGRGSFIESYPLFGYDLNDYDELFVEKLNLLLKINGSEVVSWQGKHRPSIAAQGVYPRPAQPKLPVWIGIGGTPASAVRAGKLGLPLTIAILGGAPARYVPFAELYRESAQHAGHDAAQLPLALNCHFHLADTSEQAADEFFPPYSQLMNRIGRERGWSPMNRRHFDFLRGPEGPLFVGTAQEITEKLLYLHGLFNHTRFLAQLVLEGISHQSVMHSINLFGTQVAPAVREALASQSPAPRLKQ
ncbi:LLM class flavin-dependent oxidoreductase [Hymenobacter sp. BT770]|uniref:LLM class flavin-dependent oxidoreductase n=1 Tax=Hymenobacter sp. BT770 TaxID=2886942 RepID=UPI001D120049|nr:LLM class flavin-dependent oxidoreductase [Hymenobacter sp. BT770]MCC3151916.1 LLM class flavin-dependent oxidoreductase [Hymenobacter sp. BT770]MDO3413461.1 LLM class flavin-dependent oxidoreductase [Hymenobacter sp. BT770]